MKTVNLIDSAGIHRRAAFAAMLAGIAWVGLLGAGCEPESVPNFGNVRIENDWSQDVYLYLNDDLKLDIPPGERKSARVDEGLLRISVRDRTGKELFGQLVEIPDNTFAEYIVLENGQVVATAGNIRRPDIVGGQDEQVRLENFATFPVGFYVNDTLLATIAAQANATINVPGGIFIAISFRRSNGKALFEQTLQVPRNTVIHYSVLPDGTVIATGGPIEKNTDIDRSDDGYYDYY